MARHLSDDEEVQILKNWWSDNGRSLIVIVVTILAAYLSWTWWTKYQTQYSEQASEVYSDLSDLMEAAGNNPLSEEQEQSALFIIDQLQKDYGRTIYSANASLLGAKLAVQKDDLGGAEAHLNQAIDSGDQQIKSLATLRLAKVYLAQEKHDGALDLLKGYDTGDAYASLYADALGDIYIAKGDAESARTAYQQALDSLSENNSLKRRLLEIKLSDLPPAGDAS